MYGLIVPPERPTKRAHKKSRTGCQTCKERKLKCDETRPTCLNCQRHFFDKKACIYRGASQKKLGLTTTLLPKNSQYSEQYGNASSLPLVSQNRNEISGDLLHKSLGANLLDPFQSYPESRVPDVDILMKNYLTSAVYQCFPWQLRSETNPTTTYYVPLVLGDPVLFHATLQLSALRLDKTRNVSKSAYSRLSFECIRLLRDRVENADPEKGISDETISAVATLAAIEHEKGNPKMIKMHLGGLERMIRLRGGLNSIRQTNPMVANSVFWTFASAIYEVTFPILDLVLPPFSPSEHNLTSRSQSVSHFQDLALTYNQLHPKSLDFTSIGVAPSVAIALTSIKHVSELIPTGTTYLTASDHLVILTRMCTLLSHLLSMPPIYSSDTQNSAQISESTRLAILLHVFTPWRGLPPDGTLAINYLLHRLMESLKTLMPSENYEQKILTLWIFAVGGVSAVGMMERTWFVGHLAVMTKEMQIRSWDEMKACVSRGIWHERLCGRSHKTLWEEILQRKKSWD